jgi:hypothetical protein
MFYEFCDGTDYEKWAWQIVAKGELSRILAGFMWRLFPAD